MAKLAKAFRTMYCIEGELAPKSNDFSDLRNYRVRIAILEAMTSIRKADGKCPEQIKKFLLSQLQMNDNAENPYSDDFYLASLLEMFTTAVINTSEMRLGMDFDDYADSSQEREAEFVHTAVDEITRLLRRDELFPSWKNVYTTSALNCFKTLMTRHAIPTKIGQFLPYTRPGNSDEVRLAAFSCLMAR